MMGGTSFNMIEMTILVKNHIDYPSKKTNARKITLNIFV